MTQGIRTFRADQRSRDRFGSLSIGCRLAVLLLSVCLPAASRTEPATPPHGDELAQRLIAWHRIGDTSPKPQDRFVGYGVTRRGWRYYVAAYVRPQVEAGVRRILLHNPWGRSPGDGPMAFDQFPEAVEAGQQLLTTEFVEAWRPIIDGQYSGGVPVEVICYLGSIDTDHELAALAVADDGGPGTAWLDRVVASIRPALDARMSIAIDSAGDLAPDAPENAVLQLLETLGRKVYIEPRPDAGSPQLFHLPIITTREHWSRSDPERHDSASHKAPNRLLTGETILLIRGITDQGERRRAVRDVLASTSASVAVPLQGELHRRTNLADWLKD